jgi:hypothetical protein
MWRLYEMAERDPAMAAALAAIPNWFRLGLLALCLFALAAWSTRVEVDD